MEQNSIAIAIPRELYGVVGFPLAHSLSPLVHNKAFEITEIPAAYMSWEKSPDELPGFIDAVRSLPVQGLSVTIPHKQAVIEHLDDLSENARAVGAVNTLYWRDERLIGDNTDVAGFLSPLRRLPSKPASALVLGVGGAARAVFKGLADLGVEKTLASARDERKAKKPCSEFGVRFVPWEDRAEAAAEAELIVNATPLGMAGGLKNESPLARACLSPNHTVYDLVYNPLRTRLIEQAENHGCRTIEGLDMFTAQAAEQFLLWTGRELPEPEIAALLGEILKS
jgi:shikimate dehydrogenase